MKSLKQKKKQKGSNLPVTTRNVGNPLKWISVTQRSNKITEGSRKCNHQFHFECESLGSFWKAQKWTYSMSEGDIGVYAILQRRKKN